MRNGQLDICLVAPLPPPFGGIGRWILVLRRHISEKSDVRFHIVDIGPMWGRKVYDYTRWKRIVGGGIQLIKEIGSLLGTIVYHQCKIIHLTTSGRLAVFRDLCVITVANVLSMPVVYHMHHGRIPDIANTRSLEWRLLALAMKQANVVVVIDAASERAIKKYLPLVTVAYIPNCINIGDLPSPVEDGDMTPTVVFLGWVVPEKGVEELIKAWAHIHRQDWRLHIIGPGDMQYQHELLDKYKPCGVTFLGELSHDEAMKRLARSSIFVLPSYTEGFPNVILEAMGMGKPIIASNVGAIPEMLSDDCGILIPAKNAEALEKELERIVTNPGVGREMGKRAKNRVLANYSIDVVFEQYNSVWRSAVRKKSELNYHPGPAQGDHAY